MQQLLQALGSLPCMLAVETGQINLYDWTDHSSIQQRSCIRFGRAWMGCIPWQMFKANNDHDCGYSRNLQTLKCTTYYSWYGTDSASCARYVFSWCKRLACVCQCIENRSMTSDTCCSGPLHTCQYSSATVLGLPKLRHIRITCLT